MAEELDLHLFELATAERVVARVDLVAESLADLRDAERQLHPIAVEHVLEVGEDTLSGLWSEIRLVRFITDSARVSFQHEIELPRFAEFALALRRGAGADPPIPSRIKQWQDQLHGLLELALLRLGE